MSLLMQALKKAEHAKQKQAGLPERGAPVSAEMRDTQPLAFSEIDLLPLDDVPAGAQVDDGTSSALGKLDLSEPTAELPDLAPDTAPRIDLPAALELVAADPLETAAAETRLEPAAGGVHADSAPSESAQDSTSQAPMSFPTVPPAAAWTEPAATPAPAPVQQPHAETIPPRVTAARQAEPPREPSVAPKAEPRVAAPRDTQAGDDQRAVAQQQAKNVFASKAAPGPRPYGRYLSIAGATLLVAALGGAAWYMTADQFIAPPVMAQMEPTPAQEPPMPPDALAAASDAPGAVPAVEAHAATGNLQPAVAAVATIAAATAVTAAPAAATSAVVPDAVRNPQVPAPVPAQAETAAYTVETAGIQIRRSTDTRQILSATSQAYQAFLAGEYQAAEQLYRRS
ncbi:MAG TPA: hypothetical protein VM571_04055, partial [Noviherbaspirillum sp.]|nr:hypothetical protein [Noviherbaspirillum sp.]